jgi:phosphoribosylformylglycinamidine synthase subunit PurQ / glutaminase
LILRKNNMSKPKFVVVVFPGSNCDHDAYYAIKKILNCDVKFVWHGDTSLDGADVVILPGGFSYGDYLRSGAIARFSPILNEVFRFGRRGGTIIGICNGFQILLESGLLPGAMLKNESLKFVCKFVNLKVNSNNSKFTNSCAPKEVIEIPIAHGEGNYFASEDVLKSLQDNEQILFKYCDKKGEITKESNPNGALLNIAGIINREKNILGMMPHPERAADKILNHTDGLKIFNSIINSYS